MNKRIAMVLALVLALTLTSAAIFGCTAANPAPAPATTAAAAATTASAATAAATEAAATAQTEATSEAAEELPPVKLTAYYLGDGSKDDQEVIDVLNARTAGLINTTMDRKLISWADFNTKYPLVIASGEDFDLIFTASWSFYAQQAVKGGFCEITMDMLEKYAPNVYANVPDAAWRQARIGGKIYMLPNNQEEYSGSLALLIRGDLRKKYNLPEFKSLDDLELYLDAIAQNEPGMVPLDGGSEFDKWTNSGLWYTQPNNLGAAAVSGYVYKLDDPAGAMLKSADLPEYKAYLAKMVDYNARGYWSRNAMNNETRLDDGFKNGKSATAMHNFGTMVGAAKLVQENHPEWDPEIYDSTFGQYEVIRTSFLGNGMGIHATSKNVERSLMWIDTIRFDRECYDLMMSGIEGKHWIDEGPGLSSAGPATGDYGGYSTWGFTTEQMIRKDVNAWPTQQAVMDSYRERAVTTATPYFLFDDTDYKNETAAMTEINNKYSKILDFGFDSNWEQLLADVEKQFETAGRAAVLTEAQKQLAGFISDYTK